ncbi:hypothetical protein U27_01002 [Candidatus Vecturithrix granuli]|uniref:site-specific DNA-methyltransferase (cytosine-N(4)-specific) n=1 Tax=Vecturithrix granuli TaxID=1499967 RepID=A0A081C949_VECG1|nr:hypothetical protein U27_01002 [Candidatus Vecturithrix granuli]
MHLIKSIHPFPARMAPEIALAALSDLPAGSIVLDPMMGSGTVLRMASECQHTGIGFDTDPLAVLLTRVWTAPIDGKIFQETAREIITQAKEMQADNCFLPWIDNDEETGKFIDFWFAQEQQGDLRKLANIIYPLRDPIGDALRVAMSRLIITKKHGASLAWDVSHGRPHRVRQENDFNVLEEFQKSVDFLATRLQSQQPKGHVNVKLGDARCLEDIPASYIDVMITSPPYLNAIDYVRAHKFSLVWFGYNIPELRCIRANNIGAERSYESDANLTLAEKLTVSMGELGCLKQNHRKMIARYVLDLFHMLKETGRVLKSQGKAIFVVGNSCLSDVFIKNTQAVKNAAQLLGLELLEEQKRELPPNRRYLPPPTQQKGSALRKRMRTESVLTFMKP